VISIVTHRPSVRFDRIAPAGFKILAAIQHAAESCDWNLEITSGTDSHTLPDPHVTGEAYDLSVKGMSAQTIEDVKKALDASLGPLFTVLYEVPTPPSDPTLRPIAYVNAKATGAHFHIQRKRHTTYPPMTAA
jgi:hypothetical protein